MRHLARSLHYKRHEQSLNKSGHQATKRTDIARHRETCASVHDLVGFLQ